MHEFPEGMAGPTLGAGQPLDPMPACGTCPKAMWYRTPKRLRAFCRELRIITWEDDEAEPVMQCDGREAALALPNDPTS
ncbi:MAG: hypothetical protein BVN32_00170 [Proteobacteria bacterium ST_bin14]|nr:MAG: hypothetical protein BVN32_00170 [Proteobacteria bacterium ST_bin14]